MRVYFDPSVLISFYVAEPAGAGVRKFVQAQDLLILLNPLQELELKNGIRQKVLRKEISEAVAARSLRLLETISWLVLSRPNPWFGGRYMPGPKIFHTVSR